MKFYILNLGNFNPSFNLGVEGTSRSCLNLNERQRGNSNLNLHFEFGNKLLKQCRGYQMSSS